MIMTYHEALDNLSSLLSLEYVNLRQTPNRKFKSFPLTARKTETESNANYTFQWKLWGGKSWCDKIIESVTSAATTENYQESSQTEGCV